MGRVGGRSVGGASRPWDLLVVGGGTAGIVGARTAAVLGARVLLVERDRTGGECLWTGCVPSKALLASASAAASARRAGRLGVHAGPVSVLFPEVMDHVRAAVRTIAPVDSAEALAGAGVRVVHASVRFTGPGSALVGPEVVAFSQALVATGSTPVLPDLAGSGAPVLTSDTVWDLRELPERLVVLGGGGIGCELSQAFARLGSRVVLVHRGARLLAREDADAVALVARALVVDGVEVLTGRRAVALAASTVTLDDGTRREADAVLAAIGRRPLTGELGLAAAGVDVDERGQVVVDECLRTSNHRVWAAGDVTARSRHTHTAGVHASAAATNAVLGTRRRVPAATPRVTFTDPELAAVDLGPGSPAASAGRRVRTVEHTEVDRAVVEGATAGFTRLVSDRRGHLVAATVVGPRAGEVLAELSLAVSRRLRLRDLAATTHAYPTYADATWSVAVADVRAGLSAPGARAVVGALVVLRRMWWARARPHAASRSAPTTGRSGRL